MIQDATYQVYVKWMATPQSSRTPKTQPEFLERYNLVEADLYEFQQRRTFGDDLSRETMEWAKRKTPSMIHTLYDKYKDSKNPQDLKIWQDAIKYAEENQKQTSLEDLIDDYQMDEKQLVAIAYRILETYDPKGLLNPATRRIKTKKA